MNARSVCATAVAMALLAGPGMSQEMVFGGEEDVAYAALLWKVMEADRLVGANALLSFPYEGLEPHGMLLETFYTDATVDGHTGTLIVKRNYGPAGWRSTRSSPIHRSIWRRSLSCSAAKTVMMPTTPTGIG